MGTPARVHDNVVTGGAHGIILATTDMEVDQNDLDGPQVGLTILEGGWPNRFFHENIRESPQRS